MARTLDDQGKYTKAETVYRNVLAVQRCVLGPDHPSTLTNSNNSTNTLNHQGKHTEAETMFVIQQQRLGPEHPTTLTTAMNVATTPDDQGKYAEAETAHRDVLAVQRRLLGEQ